MSKTGSNRFFVFIIIITIMSPSVCVADEMDGIKSSTPLSFIKEYPLVQQDLSFEVAGVSFGGNANFKVTIRVDMVLLIKALSKYAEEGQTTTLYVDAFNFISLLDLTGSVNVYASYMMVKYNLPVKTVNLKYAVPQTIGNYQEVIIGGDQFLGSITIPVIGPVDLFMRVLVAWTPILRGNLELQGPASVSSAALSWYQNSLSTQLSFSGNEPVSVYLSNPELVLQNFKVTVNFYAMYGVLSSPIFPIDVVQLDDYSISAPTVNLISFEPNYYLLYNELKQSITSLTSTIQQLQNTIDQLNMKVNSLMETSTQVGDQLPLIALVALIAFVALAVSLYSLKSRR